MKPASEVITTITRQLAIYDPRHLPEADFLNNFVGRHSKLEHLLQHIRTSAGENKNHLLILGSRGMGKTSMLRRIAIAIREDEELRRQWIPVNFREEQYNVRQLRFFWKNTADSVAEWCEQTGDNGNAAQLDKAQESNADADTLWDLLHNVSQQHHARLLLLVDNLNLILQNLTEHDQWALRHILSQPDGPMMIAATTALIEQFTQRDAPFYDYFHLHDLLPLSVNELRSCLIRIATTRDAAGQRVITEINRQPERLQVLYTLTNGNPRTLFHIYQILESLNPNDENTPDSFMVLLESLLDSVTPLYKARTEELAPQQRQVLDAIALAWDPKSSAWIAAETHLTSTTLSSQLKRLRELGVIEEVRLANNKNGLQVRERFYNIWYLLRHGSRRGRRRLRFFTCFLMDWYSSVERNDMARRYLRGNNKTHIEYGLALASAADSSGLERAVVQEITLSVLQRNELLDEIIGKELDSAIMNRKQQQQEVKASLQKKGWKITKIRQFWCLLSANLSLTEKEIQKVINAIEGMDGQQLMELSVHWENQKVPCATYFTVALIDMIKKNQQDGLIRDYEDIEGFLAVAEQTENNAILLFPLLRMPELATKEIPKDKIDLALGELFSRSERDSKDKNYWVGLGTLLHEQLFCYDEAEKAYRKAIELDPKFAYPWYNLGFLLQNHLSRCDEAEEAYRKAIELNPKFASPWNDLGNLLTDHFSSYDDAEKAYRKAIELDPEFAYPWNNLGNLLQNNMFRYDDAEKAYRKAIKLDPKNAYPWNGIGTLLQDHLVRYDEAEKAYLKAEELGMDNLYPTGNLCWLAIQQNQREKALKLYQDLQALPKVGRNLLNSALTLLQDNFGDAWTILNTILAQEEPILWLDFRHDLLRLVRLFRDMKYGERLLESMQGAGYSQILAPFYHAVEASVCDEELLRNINPEIRPLAESMFRWINSTSLEEIRPPT